MMAYNLLKGRTTNPEILEKNTTYVPDNFTKARTDLPLFQDAEQIYISK